MPSQNSPENIEQTIPPTTKPNTTPTVDKQTFDAERFYNYIRITYPNKSTAGQYLKFMGRLIPFMNEGQLTQTTINRFLTSISDNSSYSNPFYHGALMAVTRCFKELNLEVPKIRSAPPSKNKIKFLEYSDVTAIIREMQDPQLKIMCRLYFESGLRASELLSSTISDVDLVRRTISGIGKRNMRFTVKFSPQARKWLEQWLVKAPDSTHPFTMMGRGGVKLRSQRSALDHRLKREMRMMGKKGIHCHQFRHSLGHFLRAEKGFDIVQIKTKLRHRSIVSTEIYAVATEEEVDAKIDREVFGVQEPQGDDS